MPSANALFAFPTIWLFEMVTSWILADKEYDLVRWAAPLVDLFDVTIPDYTLEMGSSRFIKDSGLTARMTATMFLLGGLFVAFVVLPMP